MRKKKIKWDGLLISILIAQAAGIFSSLLSGNVSAAYSALVKPAFAPPGWIFGIVWPILYTLMGVAVYIVFQTKADMQKKSLALMLYILQLFFNFLWSIVFFGWGLYWAAAVIAGILLFLILLTTISFLRINKKAAILMAPYLIWVLFALYLNISIAVLN